MSSDASDTYVQNLCEIFLRDILKTNLVRHSRRSLWDHLRRTFRLLVEWKEPRQVSLAGLFHSIYGTSQFQHATLPFDCRWIVQGLIGKEAEALAHEFCLSDRRVFPWALTSQRELYTIEAANLIEQNEPVAYVQRLAPFLEGEALKQVRLYTRDKVIPAGW